MPEPVFGFLAFTSGSMEGAIIRDMRLANALHRRGYRVVVYWMMETNRTLVDPGIRQRIVARGSRYLRQRPSALLDFVGRIGRIFPQDRRRRYMQEHPDVVDRCMGNLAGLICDGGADPGMAKRLAKFIRADGVTHLLPTFAMICPFALRARQLGKSKFDYLVTFQGEEIFANFADRLGRVEEYYQRLRDVVAASPWPAVAVSRDYIQRLHDEMGINPAGLRAIYPGIDLPASPERPAFEPILTKLPDLRRDQPIVTYFGRQDSEKGIDLLLYAVKLLQERGLSMQLVICGGSSFGQRYREVCRQIAEHLRVRVFWKKRLPEEVRDALYAHSRCIVYPSIHREPFGMVAAEAMSHGTPVLVPDIGGITEVIEADGKRGGLSFRSWDTADLAAKLGQLLTDDALHAELAANTRSLAANFTVERMTDRVLEHLGVSVGQASCLSL